MMKQLNINKMNRFICRTKRYIAFVLLLFMAVSMNAQIYNTPKFLGIPIDGSKSEMISKLKQKGYTLCKEPELAQYETLEGEFNGRLVHITVVTNNNIVYRIVVQDVQTMNESDIKIRYNTLVNQFQNNKKYFSDISSGQFLDDDIDISYEMSVKNERIQACFTQRLTEDEIKSLLISQPEINNYDKDFQDIVFKQAAIESNQVWFMICKLDYLDEFWIALYYDNLNNAPNGDDL